MKKTFIVAAVALLGIAAMGAATSNPASATQPVPDGEHKVWVCKYSGKPGVDEKLKEGKNPIEVASNATDGTWFNDAQGRSYVLGAFANDPGIGACPAPDGPPNEPPEVLTPEAPTLSPLTCDAPRDVVLPDIEGLVYTPTEGTDGSIVVTVVAAEGYVLAEDSTTSWTFTAAALAELLPADAPACLTPVPPTQPPAETPVVAALPPTQPPAETAVLAAVPAAAPAAAAPAAAAPAAAPTALPTTGSESWAIFLIGLTSLLGGAALVKLSRRPA